jgi:hypothetical protein
MSSRRRSTQGCCAWRRVSGSALAAPTFWCPQCVGYGRFGWKVDIANVFLKSGEQDDGADEERQRRKGHPH